jgi:hypothetical protein
MSEAAPASEHNGDHKSEHKSGQARLKHNLWFGYIVFLILWSGAVYNWLGQEIGKHELFARVIEGHPYVSDFVNVYNSASLAAACEKEKIDIYSPTVQAEFAKKLTAPVVPEQPFYLQYPPFLFAMVRPLAYFNLLGAWFVWCALGLALVVCSAVCLLRSSALGEGQGKLPRFTLIFTIAATLASFPTWLSVELGQTSLPLVPGLVAFWICSKNRRFFLAGLASGVVLIKLQYLPPVFIVGFLLGTWRYLAGFVTVGAAMSAISIWILGLDNVLRFPHALLSGESGHNVSGVAADQMQNLRGNLVLLLGGDTSVVHIASMLAFALALAALAFLWWRRNKLSASASKTNQAASFRMLAAISTLIMLTFSPHCHTQDYLALVVPCIWLWFELAQMKKEGKSGRLLSLLQGLILLFPIFGWPFFVLRMLFQLVKIQPFFLWAVAVMIIASRLHMVMQGQKGEQAQMPLS